MLQQQLGANYSTSLTEYNTSRKYPFLSMAEQGLVQREKI